VVIGGAPGGSGYDMEVGSGQGSGGMGWLCLGWEKE
jgi:hypothetical protein